MPEEIKPEIIIKTQKSLGKYVKKPQLTEKLLKKPPFRFLHDIINAIIKETGFLKGLFTNEELSSENVKERDAKIAFLDKLINAVKAITKLDLAARPSKIVAGLEPTDTNLLLQAIVIGIDKKLDFNSYISQLNAGEPKTKSSKKSSEKKTVKSIKKTKKDELSPKANNQSKIQVETPKSTDRSKFPKQREPKKYSKTENKATIEKSEEIKPDLDELKQVESHELISCINTDETTNSETKQPALIENEPKKRVASASRPKSARPRSGDLVKEQKIETKPTESRPKTSLRPPSVRPSSARPGAPRLRPDSALPIKETVPMGKINVIVENFDQNRDDEEETVVIHNNSEAIEQNEDDIDLSGSNKGHLVEQILEQINEGDKLKTKNVEIDWQNDFVSKGSASKEMANLRSMIQHLTKTANPLGKLLNYLHEDIEAMQGELEQWTFTRKQLVTEISKQKQISLEMNKPLVLQLENLNLDIKKFQDDVVATRSNILRNETKIRKLISE